MRSPYDYIAERWHASPREQTYVDRVLRYVDKILEGLPAEAKVLDLGCGTGNPVAEHIVRRGYRVVGVDESKRMLEIAKTIVPEAELIHGNMVDVELPDEFAAAVAWDSIFHVERKHHQSGSESCAADSVSGDGSGVEGFTSEMYGHTFFYDGYAPEVARRLLEAEGFEVELWEVDDPSSRGHIAVIAKKRT